MLSILPAGSPIGHRAIHIIIQRLSSGTPGDVKLQTAPMDDPAGAAGAPQLREVHHGDGLGGHAYGQLSRAYFRSRCVSSQ